MDESTPAKTMISSAPTGSMEGEDALSFDTSFSAQEETKTPSPPRPPIAPSMGSSIPSPTISYVSSASAPSPPGAVRSSIVPAGSFGSEFGARDTINSGASSTILRKDSDDASYSKIKPVHNFFSQQQFGYDSDGSDGSLIFSPALTEDQKSKMAGSSRMEAFTRRKDAAFNQSSTINRDRAQSTDSNGSVRYVNKAQHCPSQPPSSSEPVNPQLLPYHERRKLMQQKQQLFEQSHAQQQQQQMQQTYHYQYAMMIQAQQAAQYQQHMALQQQKQGQLSPTQHPSQAYPMDPGIAAAYYQMYGMPPTFAHAGMFSSSHSPNPSVISPNAYPYPGPQTGAYIPPQSSAQHYHRQNNSGSGHIQYPSNHPYPQQYQPFATPSHSIPQPYGYMPNPTTQSEAQPPGQPRQQQMAQTPEREDLTPKTTVGRKDRFGIAIKAATSAAPVITSNSKSAKNPPRPPSGLNKPPPKSQRNFSTGSVPPPPPPPSQTKVVGHGRADSSGSMSSLESYGPGGVSASSFSREDDDDPPPPPIALPVLKPPPPPSPPPQQQSISSQAASQPKTLKNSSSVPPALIPPTLSSAKRSIGSSIDSAPTPESPHEGAHARNHSFLDRLRLNWSPQSRDSPSGSSHKKPSVEDFHRSNQEFLQRNTLVSTFPSPKASPGMQHRRLGSHDRPPASRGTHRRLTSISNDEWGEESSERETSSNNENKKRSVIRPLDSEDGRKKDQSSNSFHAEDAGISEASSESGSLLDDDRHTDDSPDYSFDEADEQTSLLPPTGISTDENDEKDSNHGRGNWYGNQNYAAAASGRRHQKRLSMGQIPISEAAGYSSSNIDSDPGVSTEKGDNRADQVFKKSKKKIRRKKSKQRSQDDDSNSSEDFSDEESFDYRKWTKKRQRMLERERSKLIEKWKEEARADAELTRKEFQSNQWHRRCWRHLGKWFHKLSVKAFRLMTLLEAFIGNLPLTIGAVAMAVVTLGVVWFKFAEEYLSTCEPVQFHSSQCTFPEFPGCFYCDTKATGYRIALGFHYGCKVVSGVLALLVVIKILLATRVVVDEMSSPTTSSPAGLLCMTSVCVFAGRGLIGQIVVSSAACVHLGLAIWFIYMALAYHIMPEPSWFPNTVGIGISAVKTWLYYPMPGHLLMAISLSLMFFFFPISLIRVAANKKISATVGWMQMGAPAISLYALTIMAQPSFEQEQPDVTNFQRMHRMVYLPCMHVMCALSILGAGASIHSLYVRWPEFKQKEFSPAHAAFCFPTLSHANAIQAYRGAVLSFSSIPPGTWRMFLLDAYWFAVLMGGTIATFVICGRFLWKLPEWTSPDLSDEEEPPAPYDTLLSRQQIVTAGDTLTQPFVSPAILQANETGALILARSTRDGTLRYVRTRRVRAFGFEPTMNWSEMQAEREVLLEWVGKHPPRRRHRTLSVPGIDFRYGASIGNSGVYGSFSPFSPTRRRFMSHGGEEALY